MTEKMTQQHKNVYAALASAQAEMGKALKQANNPHFRSKYADLGNVMDACLPALNKHGIAVAQPFIASEFGHAVKTVLYHGDSETSAECTIPLILGKNDMQGLGSAITYARRYGLMAMAGIAPEDDDGNAAAESVKNAPSKIMPTAPALDDAWRDAVLDSLPDNATERQKAEAFADAICRDFKGKNGVKALDNDWRRREKIIAALKNKHLDLWEQVIDAYEIRKNELSPSESESIPA